MTAAMILFTSLIEKAGRFMEAECLRRTEGLLKASEDEGVVEGAGFA